MIKDKVIAIDFDNTITEGNFYPKIGNLRKNAKEVINELYKNNIICIWTCREGKELDNAYRFLNLKKIKFHYINSSPYDSLNFNMRKIIADYYIDDHNIFCEEIDWIKIKKYFQEKY